MSDHAELRRAADKYGVPAVDLGEVVILIEDLDLIPREVCETHRILPLLSRGEHLFLAMLNAADKRVIDEIEFVTGKKVYPYVALGPELARATEAAHQARGRGATYYFGAGVAPARLRELGIDAKGMVTGPNRRPIATQDTPLGVLAPVAPTVVARPREDARTEAGARERETDPGIIEPVDDAAEVAGAPSADTRGSAGRYSAVGTTKLILVVDDEQDIRVMLKKVLVAKGHRVIEAETGPLALQSVKQNVPDLLILDAMLPGLHGFDVARRLKTSERYGAIPIIMISAVYRGWRVVEDLKTSYGIFDYLEKPFRLGDVVDAATRALAARDGDEMPGPDLDLLSEDAQNALEQGIAAYRAGDLDRAITIIQGGTKKDPLAYRLHFHLALLFGKKDQIFDGIGELEVAIELHPKHFPSLKNLALLYERAGFKNRAVEMWERCVHAAPDAASRAQVKERLLHLL